MRKRKAPGSQPISASNAQSSKESKAKSSGLKPAPPSKPDLKGFQTLPVALSPVESKDATLSHSLYIKKHVPKPTGLSCERASVQFSAWKTIPKSSRRSTELSL